MDIAAPLARPSEDATTAAQRSRLVRPLLAAAVVLALAGAAILAWPDSAVVLESSPNGADVLVDGRVVGQTPLRLSSRPWPLRREAAVSLAGYRAWSGAVEAGLGQTGRVQVPLEPLPATLALVSNPPGAVVQVDGRVVGQTPLELSDLAPGRHAIALMLDGYEPWDDAAELAPGGRLLSEVRLRPLVLPPLLAASLASPPATLIPPAAPPAVPPPTEPAAGRPASAPPGPEPIPAILPPHPGPLLAPLAIMVENAPAARPQSGLVAADVVYEALAEGGISRFMAVYFGDEPTTVGPVRSARHYFVNLASELGAALVHIGASPLGYEVLRAAGLRNLDETYADPGFWRSRARPAPHNAYTSVRDARTALDARSRPQPGQWAGFSFKDPARAYTGPSAPLLSLDYEPWNYRVEYRYDPEAKRYARFMDGAPHRDAETGEQVSAAGVAVLRVSAWVIDREGRLDMDQVSQGPAAYFVDGVVVSGSWRKEAPGDPTRFLDEAGNPIRFNPGPIWVQLIPYEGKVDY